MNALLTNPDLEGMPHLQLWLKHAQRSLSRYNDGAYLESDLTPTDQLALINVTEQLENLRTHAVVREKERDGKLKLMGLFFDLDAARVLVYDAQTKRFQHVKAGPELLTTGSVSPA